jgi:hypothetical protein
MNDNVDNDIHNNDDKYDNDHEDNNMTTTKPAKKTMDKNAINFYDIIMIICATLGAY